MSIKELAYKNRTYRRFDQSVKIDMSTLEELTDYARLSSSARNAQAVKYVLVTDEKMCEVVFSNIKWAAALPDWPGPAEGEKPTAYIIPFRDDAIGKNILWDLGLFLQNITMGAVEKGLGCCHFGNVNYPALKEALGVTDENLVPLCVLAIGKPVETVVLVDIPESGATKYYRDENMVHYVPKRKLEDIIAKKY
jgi:nitroreductase